MSDLKKQLYDLCVSYVQNRKDAVVQAIKASQQAANEDTKSSAGDKYETGRAMMQQDTDRNQAQLNEANKLMVVLNRLGSSGTATVAEAGSLVITDNGKFYIAISAGVLTVNGEPYFAVSAASPIGMKLTGKMAGDDFTLNGKIFQIHRVV